MSHKLKEAKNNLSGLIRQAEKGEPQIIRRNEKQSLVEFIQKSPLDEILPFLERNEDSPREML